MDIVIKGFILGVIIFAIVWGLCDLAFGQTTHIDTLQYVSDADLLAKMRAVERCDTIVADSSFPSTYVADDNQLYWGRDYYFGHRRISYPTIKSDTLITYREVIWLEKLRDPKPSEHVLGKVWPGCVMYAWREVE